MTHVEYRSWDPDATEMRAVDDGMSFTGRAIVYNSRSEDIGFRETILPGAATRTLKSRNEIKALIGHDSTLVIGSTRAKTLRLSEDERGVVADVDLPDTSYGRDLSVSVKRRDITSMSFGFTVVKDAWNEDYSERTISELRLHEVSVVAMPAYAATSANVRALARLAHRAEQDVDALADAMTALESGAEINDDQAAVLLETIERVRPKAEPEPELEPEPAAAFAPLSLMSQKLDLIKHQLAL